MRLATDGVEPETTGTIASSHRKGVRRCPRSRSIAVLGLLCAVASGALASSAVGTVVVAPSLAELAIQADVVVVAHVERVGVRVELHDRRPVPFTRVGLRVERTLGGRAPGRIVVSELGGDAPTGSLHVEGTPRYRAGERVVAFLVRRGAAYRTVALALGRFAIRRSPTGREIAERDTSELVLLDLPRKTMSTHTVGTIDLEALADIVRRAREGR
jgi:hypothetical protein